LLAEAQAVTGAATKKETVRLGLETLVRLGRQAQLRKLRGGLSWEGDLDAMRRDA
jgi:Arc/MetJ family transcription regulator